jgi:hypothetical protein
MTNPRAHGALASDFLQEETIPIKTWEWANGVFEDGIQHLIEDQWVRLPRGKKVHRIALGFDTYCGLSVRLKVLKLSLVGNPLEKDKCSFCHWSADPND